MRTVEDELRVLLPACRSGNSVLSSVIIMPQSEIGCEEVEVKLD